MYERVGEYDFVDAFRRMNRLTQFSYEGLHALYKYLTDLEDDLGKEFELDVIALCCDYNEYESFEQYLEEGNSDYEDLDDLADNLTVIRVGDEGFIVEAH